MSGYVAQLSQSHKEYVLSQLQNDAELYGVDDGTNPLFTQYVKDVYGIKLPDDIGKTFNSLARARSKALKEHPELDFREMHRPKIKVNIEQYGEQGQGE